MIETKVIMALTLRSFDIKAVCEELDVMETNRGLKKQPKGENGTQVRIATAKAVDRMSAKATKMGEKSAGQESGTLKFQFQDKCYSWGSDEV